SAFDCRLSKVCPAASVRARRSASISARVTQPYTSGSRSPSRLRLGPCRTSSFAMGAGKGRRPAVWPSDKRLSRRSLPFRRSSRDLSDRLNPLSAHPVFYLAMLERPDLLFHQAALGVDQRCVRQYALGIAQ